MTSDEIKMSNKFVKRGIMEKGMFDGASFVRKRLLAEKMSQINKFE
jgi:hypothetical protein